MIIIYGYFRDNKGGKNHIQLVNADRNTPETSFLDKWKIAGETVTAIKHGDFLQIVNRFNTLGMKKRTFNLKATLIDTLTFLAYFMLLSSN